MTHLFEEIKRLSVVADDPSLSSEVVMPMMRTARSLSQERLKEMIEFTDSKICQNPKYIIKGSIEISTSTEMNNNHFAFRHTIELTFPHFCFNLPMSKIQSYDHFRREWIHHIPRIRFLMYKLYDDIRNKQYDEVSQTFSEIMTKYFEEIYETRNAHTIFKWIIYIMDVEVISRISKIWDFEKKKNNRECFLGGNDLMSSSYKLKKTLTQFIEPESPNTIPFEFYQFANLHGRKLSSSKAAAMNLAIVISDVMPLDLAKMTSGYVINS